MADKYPKTVDRYHPVNRIQSQVTEVTTQISKSHIIQPKGDLLNGIEGWLNLKDTRKLTIVLGHQSVSKVRVKSVSALNTDDIQLIVNSLRKGDCPSETSGITVEVYVEI